MKPENFVLFLAVQRLLCSLSRCASLSLSRSLHFPCVVRHIPWCWNRTCWPVRSFIAARVWDPSERRMDWYAYLPSILQAQCVCVCVRAGSVQSTKWISRVCMGAWPFVCLHFFQWISMSSTVWLSHTYGVWIWFRMVFLCACLWGGFFFSSAAAAATIDREKKPTQYEYLSVYMQLSNA